MIVLDEQISNSFMRAAVETWYPGAVAYVTDLRPHTRILDEEIAKLLFELKRPTFVTINYSDFWRKATAHPRYSMLCLKLSTERWREVPDITRALLQLPDFATKNQRMGKIISWSDGVIDYYER